VTTLGYLRLWQDSDQPSRANIPLGELTEIMKMQTSPLPVTRKAAAREVRRAAGKRLK